MPYWILYFSFCQHSINHQSILPTYYFKVKLSMSRLPYIPQFKFSAFLTGTDVTGFCEALLDPISLFSISAPQCSLDEPLYPKSDPFLFKTLQVFILLEEQTSISIPLQILQPKLCQLIQINLVTYLSVCLSIYNKTPAILLPAFTTLDQTTIMYFWPSAIPSLFFYSSPKYFLHLLQSEFLKYNQIIPVLSLVLQWFHIASGLKFIIQALVSRPCIIWFLSTL